MLDNMGVSVKDVVEAVVNAYKRGFDDAIAYLKKVSDEMDLNQLKQSVETNIRSKGKTNAEW